MKRINYDKSVPAKRLDDISADALGRATAELVGKRVARVVLRGRLPNERD